MKNCDEKRQIFSPDGIRQVFKLNIHFHRNRRTGIKIKAQEGYTTVSQ